MLTSTQPSKKNESRRGVALIIVLGMIALLMILGVAFSVTMRTERMSAGFYVHQVRGEHLAHTAIAQALAQVSQGMTNAQVYPDWGLIDGQRSMVTGSTSTNAACTDLLTDTIRAYLPGLVVAQAETYVDNENVRWIEAPGGLGSFSYLIINTSGLLDANHAGGGFRHYGTNAAEIAIGVLPEMADANVYTGFRAVDVRYETLPEVWHRHRPAAQGGTDALSERPTTLNIRPPIPVARRGDDDEEGVAVEDWVAIGGSVGELIENQDEIIAAFAASGIDNTTLLQEIDMTQAQVAFHNLIDYVDDNQFPGDLGFGNANAEIPSVEANPMFNEFDIEYTINLTTNAMGGWDYEVTGQLFFESIWLFPPLQFSGPYTFHHNVTFESTAPGGAFAAETPTMPAQFPITTAPVASPGFFTFDVDVPPLDGQVAALPGEFEINATVTTWTMYEGQVIDTNMPLTVSIPFDISSPGPETENRGMECIDPRLNFFDNLAGFPNWMVTDESAASSIGAMNQRALGMLGDDFETDGQAGFFVPNRPLRTVGELGYLFYGIPWQTIRLYRHYDDGGVYSDTLHTVLDYFTITTNRWRHGLINPNTESLWAVTAALTGMPYSEDADATTPALTQAQAMQLASAWSEDAFNMGYVKNLSDIGEFTNVFYNTFVEGWPERQKEALLRNAAGLFHPRQNHFTIIVAVNTFGAAGLEIGARRLIAEVWRDPHRQADNGNHATYLRFFRWVD